MKISADRMVPMKFRKAGATGKQKLYIQRKAIEFVPDSKYHGIVGTTTSSRIRRARGITSDPGRNNDSMSRKPPKSTSSTHDENLRRENYADCKIRDVHHLQETREDEYAQSGSLQKYIPDSHTRTQQT